MDKKAYKMKGREYLPGIGLIKYTNRIRELPLLQKLLMQDKFDYVFTYHLITTGIIIGVPLVLGLEALLI